jgi:plastocyanin
MRTRMVLCLAGVIVIIVAAQAGGQQVAPTVTVTASPTAVSVSATAPLPAGPTRLDIVRPAGTPDIGVYVALLVPGYTVDEISRELALEDKGKGGASLAMVAIQASVAIEGKATHQALTFNAKPGLTYYILAEPNADSKGKVKQRAFATFTTSTDSNGATAPAPDATIRFQGLSFKGASTLPRTGTVRFENRDDTNHFALAFPLRSGVTTKQLGKAVKSNSDAAFGKLAAGPPELIQNVISGGYTANDQELTFAKKGKYGLLCYIDGHQLLGMYRIVTVK